MSDHNKQTFKQPIPEGWVQYTPGFKVAGIGFRLPEVNTSLENNEDPKISLRTEPDNKHDKNAIQILIHRKRFFMSAFFHIGYIPSELAALLYSFNAQHIVKPRITTFYHYPDGARCVIVDLIGPTELCSPQFRKAVDECEFN